MLRATHNSMFRSSNENMDWTERVLRTKSENKSDTTCTLRCEEARTTCGSLHLSSVRSENTSRPNKNSVRKRKPRSTSIEQPCRTSPLFERVPCSAVVSEAVLGSPSSPPTSRSTCNEKASCACSRESRGRTLPIRQQRARARVKPSSTATMARTPSLSDPALCSLLALDE